jgi:hypothetical protein
VGFCDYRASESEESCDVGAGNCCIECNKYRHCLPLSCLERTVCICTLLQLDSAADKDSSLYRMGCIVLTVALLCCAGASLVLRFWLQRLNRKSDQAVGLEGVANGPGVLFRYML